MQSCVPPEIGRPITTQESWEHAPIEKTINARVQRVVNLNLMVVPSLRREASRRAEASPVSPRMWRSVMIVSNTKIGKGIQMQIILGLGKLGLFYVSKKHKSETRANFLYEWYIIVISLHYFSHIMVISINSVNYTWYREKRPDYV